MVFDLSPDWEDLSKRVTFFPCGEEEGVAVLMEKSSVPVPDEVMARAGTAFFVLDGIDSMGRALVSSRGELRIIETATPGGGDPIEHVPSEIDQLRAALESLRREVAELKKEAA